VLFVEELVIITKSEGYGRSDTLFQKWNLADTFR